MAETIVSPGILTRENDQSQITSAPVVVGAALLGPTVKGKPNIPTIVTSYSDYQSKFGSTFTSGSGATGIEKSFLTSIAAKNYFDNGGETLAVTRVVSSSTAFSPASSSLIVSTLDSGALLATPDVLLDAVSGAFNITGSNLAEVTGITPSSSLGDGSGLTLSLTLTDSQSLSTITVTAGGTGYNIGDILVIESASAGATLPLGQNIEIVLSASQLQHSEPFILETLSEGTILNSDGTTGTNGVLTNGTDDNFRWEIRDSNTTNGTFSLIIRRGDDRNQSKIVLEQFTNLSLDPRSPNYITRQIGDQTQTLLGSGTTDVYLQTTGSYRNASRYVRVKEVKLNTPDYLDNNGVAKTAFTASIPTNQSGAFGTATGEIFEGADTLYQNINATRTQGLGGESYNDAINLHANKDDFRFNVISTPGLYYEGYSTQINRLIEVVENRGDAIAVVDLVGYGSTLTNVNTQASNVDSSYAATYWPWVQIQEPDLGTLEFVFPSTLIPGVYAFTDNVSEPWFAPAGINRGGLGSVNQAERKLTQLNRDSLYTNKVNPLATFPGRGVVVFGQKTLQTKATALDRVNVRRLLIALKSFIGQVADNLVFEQNTAATRNNFLSQVNPYLESVQQRQGLFAFNVVMDDSNNTPDVIDRNQLVGQIFVQPTRTAEFIILDFNILPTGAEFPS
jgi:phage tail sheath protein FI